MPPASGKSRAVVLKLNPQLLLQQEQAMAASLANASSPMAMPSSPLAPPTPPPGPSNSNKRKSSNTSSAPKRKRKPVAPSSPLLGASDPPTRPLSALGGRSPAAESAFSSAQPTGTTTPTNGSILPLSHHAPHAKLGPKANQGSINAQLRALDRSGRPCRRWTSIPLELKSFTGWEWSVMSWYGGPKDATEGTKSKSGKAAAHTEDDGNQSPTSTSPAPPPLTITIPSLSAVAKTKESVKVEDPSKKSNRRFPAILLRNSLDELEA